jgi:hypothetical protein
MFFLCDGFPLHDGFPLMLLVAPIARAAASPLGIFQRELAIEI